MAMRQVAGTFAAVVRKVIVPELERFAPPPEQRTDAADGDARDLVDKARAALAGVAGKIGPSAGTVGDRVVRHSKEEFKRLGINLRKEEPKFDRLITGWRKENVGLIESLVGRELDTIQALLRDGEGRRVESLAGDIEERLRVTRSKAELLARDQVLKLNAKVTGERQQAAGIEEYIWTSSGDERVRERHADLDGEKFRWDDPPVTNEDGDKNHPGEDYQCRCTAYPALPELGEEPTPEPDAGGESPPREPPKEPPVSLPDEEPRREPREPARLPPPERREPPTYPLPEREQPDGDFATFHGRAKERAEEFLERSRWVFEPMRRLGEEVVRAVRSYTGADYADVNEALRYGRQLPPALQALADRVRSGIRAAQAEGATVAGKVYRGLDIRDADSFLRQLGPVGGVWEAREFLSTSVAEEVASKFVGPGARRVLLEIEGRSGVPLANVSIFRSKEGEVLFDRGSRFEVVSIDRDQDGGHRIKLREVR